MGEHEAARTIALQVLGVGDAVSEGRIREVAQRAIEIVAAEGSGVVVDEALLVRELEANVTTYIGSATVLVDESSDHEPWLPDRRNALEWNFSRRYLRFLRENKGWAGETITRLDQLTDRVLELMEDPGRTGTWDRRGMVVGQVQSGKTANYVDLISKAADAGYKFIVILTGVTNSLRAQTQLRVDEGMIGWDTRLHLEMGAANKRLGVGLLSFSELYRVIASTNAKEHGDFSLRVANQFNVMLGGDPVVMVVKKNGSVLRNLNNWARSLHQTAEGQTIADIPMLLVDDEADTASVNTRATGIGSREDDEDPTKINGLIRQLLASFAKSVYVGYTATPFANIFIYPEQYSERFGDDLFPRDFLINLPVPSNHMGPTRVFGIGSEEGVDVEAIEPLPLVREVTDSEEAIPGVHRKDLDVERLPDSLGRALRDFLLVCAARAARGDQGEHNSMLVHVTRFTDVQRRVVELLNIELRELQNRIRYGDGDAQQSLLQEFEQIWQEDFVPTSSMVRQMAADLSIGCIPLTWDQVRAHLVSSSQKLQVLTINGTVRDALNYWDHPQGISVIAVGGDKLSRGLTLEGLSVSYFLRASRMYDTLLQMGRWFGFRPGYADLCRLYTTPQLIDFYRHITMATEELKAEFDRMADSGMTPREFGLRVRNHPAGLEITARNKMRSGVRVTSSYSGKITETISFDKLPDQITRIANRVEAFLSAQGAPRGEYLSTRGARLRHWVWESVPGEKIATLLGGLPYHDGGRRVRWDVVSQYIRSQIAEGGLVEWTVALVSDSTGRSGRKLKIGGLDIASLERKDAPGSTDQAYRIGRLVSPTDEQIGLTGRQTDDAMELTRERYRRDPKSTLYRGSGEPRIPGGPSLREQRSSSKGLLLIYPLRKPNDSPRPYLGIAVSFPFADHDTPVEYTANSVWMKWLEEEMDAEA